MGKLCRLDKQDRLPPPVEKPSRDSRFRTLKLRAGTLVNSILFPPAMFGWMPRNNVSHGFDAFAKHSCGNRAMSGSSLRFRVWLDCWRGTR